MLAVELTDKLRELADETDAEADHAYERERREEGTAKRGRASFLRDLADALDWAEGREYDEDVHTVSEIAGRVRR